MSTIHIIGGGLAGSEAAWQAAQAGCRVVLHEMRPQRMTEAHTSEGLAELVCSNSFRSDDWENNAVGLLHEEMRRLDSLIMRSADAHKLPAGGALAVDRVGFSKAVQAAVEEHPQITIEREEVLDPPTSWDSVIIATGPLTSQSLSQTLRALTGEDSLAFFDAIAPIVEHESIGRLVVIGVRRNPRLQCAHEHAWHVVRRLKVAFARFAATAKQKTSGAPESEVTQMKRRRHGVLRRLSVLRIDPTTATPPSAAEPTLTMSPTQ